MATHTFVTEQQQANIEQLAHMLRGRMKYMLMIFVLLHFTVPFSEAGDVQQFIYFLTYTILLGFGVYVASANRIRLNITLGIAIFMVVIGTIWIFAENPSLLISVSTFGLLLAFIGMITLIMAEFVILSERVTRDVLFAALVVYLMLGHAYTTGFRLLELLTVVTTGESAFLLGSSPEAEITWQKLYYFSYTTLTTLGYGDILPVSSLAQSLATSETIVGVLYTSVMIARLVSLYQTDIANSQQSNTKSAATRVQS